MSWLGKAIGSTVGFLMGGPFGALLGTAVGHQFDRRKEVFARIESRLDADDEQRLQMAFFTATFSVMGHLAKADGHISQAEIDVARTAMDRLQLAQDLRQVAVRLFTEGKQPGFQLDETLELFRRACFGHPSFIRLFFELLLETAYADGYLRPSEERLLLRICDRIHLSRFEFYALKARIDAEQRLTRAGYERAGRRAHVSARKASIEEMYALLGVRPSATNAEIKRAYRRLISQHHPDKLAAQGLPAETVRTATERTQQIRRAYELIAQARNL